MVTKSGNGCYTVVVARGVLSVDDV